MATFGGWEVVGSLGKGGQSEVYKVRSPARSSERKESLRNISLGLHPTVEAERLALSVWNFARPDAVSELGALKRYKISGDEPEAVERLRNEVAALGQGRAGLPKLLASSVEEQWIVTELFSDGSLERRISEYKGNATRALSAFRSLAVTVAALHKSGYIHRDIKPHNIFLRTDSELVLGDFGIVYVPAHTDRVTITNERVGPRDYMPPWADLGERLENVHPNFDVYMLGKLLWCMIAGRLKLPREYHKRDAFNLVKLFPSDRRMHLINSILDKCVVEEPNSCLPDATWLLQVVDEVIATIEHATPFRDGSGSLLIPCRICGVSFYRDRGTEIRPNEIDAKNMPSSPIHLHIFVCDVCAHYAFFAPGHPEEAVSKNWTPWSR